LTHHALATFLFLFAATAAPSSTDAPVQELKTRVDQAVQALADPATKGPAKVQERRARGRKIADEIFDFAERAKRSMGPHWQQLPQGDRERFVSLFSDLLDRAYFEKIDAYNGEKVTYLPAKIDGDQATVQTRIVTPKGTEIPVDYRMLQEQGRWMVYDVIIEGVSLVASYRAQFDRIIRTGSMNELMKRMEAQVSSHGGLASPGAEPKKPRGAARE